MSSSREKLIQLLSAHMHTFVSGQWLSEQLDISRTAIWKQIKQLKSDGYQFEAVPNKGYRLISQPDKVSENTIYWGLNTNWLGKTLEHYEEIDSTQRLANQKAQVGAQEGLVIVSDRQTKGKGRLDRNWDSDNAKGIWLSFILRPKLLPSEAPQLTLLTAICLADTIKSLTNVEPSIKWPNDLLINEKKIAGILTEMQAEQDQIHYLVIGIGLNVNQNQSDFPSGLGNIATSLATVANQEFHKQEIIRDLLMRFETYYQNYLTDGFKMIKSKWESYAYKLGEILTYRSGKQRSQGKMIGIADDGALIIEDVHGHKTKKLYSAEIEWF
ncbi:biotin--[acetyl-CoA-carboxylase] ligase [Amphibacillus jilinensis]|uniref:biotin--[acetyl-CoA-carboxylase] ligase n=1 Tax=Amphibacillus jilinensis TaxID=1216008 RepID=UPI0002EDA362|nr:biotin--[acetyl-CoA-carboxylase] ligase [Amphibacillus jilinensis]